MLQKPSNVISNELIDYEYITYIIRNYAHINNFTVLLTKNTYSKLNKFLCFHPFYTQKFLGLFKTNLL